MDEQDPVYLILMDNTRKCDDKYIKRVFDLKGSTVDRKTKGIAKTSTTLKD